MAIGLGVLGFAPLVFWQMTPREFDAAIRGRLGLSGYSDAPTKTDLAELMQQYPDERHAL
ncbi:MAG: hypothetical protein CTY31_08015 [Hyphomicrobium sp.]|nr:MAG: hypothetical protein CTY31_08015 [Hyphomicrobium sp.]